MTNQHPIVPPPELVREWDNEAINQWVTDDSDTAEYIALLAAQWGADQELEACCEWAQGYAECGDSLRAARRPKPPSPAEQALEIMLKDSENLWSEAEIDIIRRAIERLQELEGGNG